MTVGLYVSAALDVANDCAEGGGREDLAP